MQLTVTDAQAQWLRALAVEQNLAWLHRTLDAAAPTYLPITKGSKQWGSQTPLG